MEISWESSRCVMCGSERQLSRQHVIPEAIGGQLVCRFLCTDCNSTLGADIEATSRLDPSVRLAAESLQSVIPELASRILRGQEYFANTATGQVRARRAGDRLAIQGDTLPDGSVIVPSGQSEAALRTMLRRAGAGENEVSATLKRFRDAGVDKEVELGRGVRAIPRSADDFRPRLSTEFVDDRLALAIAYQFLALIVTDRVFDAHFDPVRATLRSKEPSGSSFKVERGRSNRGGFDPVHIISVQQTEPYLIVAVRLFRWIWFDVHFSMVALAQARIAYINDLPSGQERVLELPQEAE